jgi:hypothetical protein
LGRDLRAGVTLAAQNLDRITVAWAVGLGDERGRDQWSRKPSTPCPAKPGYPLSRAVEVAIGEAKTAAIFRRRTQVLEQSVSAGRSAPLSLSNMMPVEGGLPVCLCESRDRRNRRERSAVDRRREGADCRIRRRHCGRAPVGLRTAPSQDISQRIRLDQMRPAQGSVRIERTNCGRK